MAAEKKPGLTYVVQKHAARHLHYDLRLERDGVLKSWAVPKGPPAELGQRRLAMQVDDHELSYASFEGTIPEGSYGAGTVEIWDSGTHEPVEWGDRMIETRISGRRLSGTYVLLRFEKGGENAWLLFRKKDS